MSDWLNRTHLGDCRTLMRHMIADGVRVNCVVTSPPYWGLRDYQVAGQFGLERSWIRHVARMRGVFRLVRELLADDGTLWLNYGDSYASNGGSGWQGKNGQRSNRRFTLTRNQVAFRKCRRSARNGLKPKDLVGMPWRVALALQADGWWLRSDIIWHKLNCMPESITDRPWAPDEPDELDEDMDNYEDEYDELEDAMKTCPDCGQPVYDLGCTWCNEALYIEQQNHFDWLAEKERRAEEKSCKSRQEEVP